MSAALHSRLRKLERASSPSGRPLQRPLQRDSASKSIKWHLLPYAI